MQIKVYSRPGIGDVCDTGRFVYNGSFSTHLIGSLTDATSDHLEGWAGMLDCFQEVLFVTDGSNGVSPHAVTYSRSWEA